MRAEALQRRYPDTVLIKATRGRGCTLPALRRSHLMVPKTLTVGHLLHILRNRLAISADVAVFLFVDGVIPPCSQLIGHLDASNREEHDILHIEYASENAFG